jgi:hypothetical protein
MWLSSYEPFTCLSNKIAAKYFQILTGPGTHQFLIDFTGSLDLHTLPAFWKLDVYLLVLLIARLL